MGWPDGWAWEIPVAVRATAIDATLSNWTAILTEATLPDHVFDHAQNGGGDLRFYGGKNGTNRLACDVRIFDTANGIADIAVLIPTVSSTVDTVIYLRYGKAGVSQPAPSEPYGQYASYDEYTVGVWSLNEDPSGTAPQMKNRASNLFHGTAQNLSQESGMAGNAARFVDNPRGRAMLGIGALSLALHGSPAITMSSWFRPAAFRTAASNQNIQIACWISNSEFGFSFGIDATVSPERLYMASRSTSGESTQILLGAQVGVPLHAWSSLACVNDYSAKTQSAFVNGQLTGHRTTTWSKDSYTSVSNDSNFQDAIGYDGFDPANRQPSGLIDEARLANTSRSAAWIAADYRNLKYPAAFWAPASPRSNNRRRRLLLACGG
jgi:hypothetical protein